jgi:nuclease-like protein
LRAKATGLLSEFWIPGLNPTFEGNCAARRTRRKWLRSKAAVGKDAAVFGNVDALFRMLFVQGFGVCVLLLLGNKFRWGRELATPRCPVREKLLRSAGESLRRRLEQLYEYLIYSVAIFLLVPALFASHAPILTDLWAIAVLAGLMGLCALPGFWVIRLYRAYALGLRAQRAVGEELNQLMLDACHVFHDYPAAKDWTIDHIVVGASGVYAIETSTHPKRRAPEAQEENEVIFDGKQLQFPNLTTSEPISQARRSASDLSRQIATALGEAIEVKPVLTLPGWWIRDRGTSDVMVVNAKDIWQRIITPAPARLSTAQIQRVCYFLQQKCRDVEI